MEQRLLRFIMNAGHDRGVDHGSVACDNSGEHFAGGLAARQGSLLVAADVGRRTGFCPALASRRLADGTDTAHTPKASTVSLNEIPTVLLIGIVVLVIVKPFLGSFNAPG